MKIINLFPLSIIQEKILLEENIKSEMNKEIEIMVSKSKNKDYKNKDDSWTGDTQGFEYLHKNQKFKEGIYHPGNWRKLVDYGCGTLGDMGVHIFDTPYNALMLDVPKTVKNECREPNGYGFPEKNKVTYIFPPTKYTSNELKWVWYDGVGAPSEHIDLQLPNNEKLHDQGAMFMGEKGRLYLPHFQKLPQLIIDGKYKEINVEKFGLGTPVRDYSSESKKHYHEFVDSCLGKGICSAPFSYSSKLTETILLGVIAGRFPGKTLNWNKNTSQFSENEANVFIGGNYRSF